MESIKDKRYLALIQSLRNSRKSLSIPQRFLAEKLGVHQSYIAKVEGLERRLDIVELINWVNALELDPYDTFISAGFMSAHATTSPVDKDLALPLHSMFSSFYELSPFPVMLICLNSQKIIEANSACEKLLGCDPISSSGDILNQFESGFHITTEISDHPVNKLIQFDRPDQSTRFLNCHITPVRSNTQNSIVLTLNDVSNRIFAEISLEKQKHLTAEILNSLPFGVYVKDLEHRYILTNQQYLSLSNLENQNIIGLTDSDLFPNEITRNMLQEDEKVIQDNIPVVLERWQSNPFRADKQRMRLRITKSPIKDSSGCIIGTMGLLTDTTAEIDNETYQSELNARFLEIFKNTPIPVLISCYENGLIIDANEAFLDLVGYKLKEMVGLTSIEAGLMPSDTRSKIREKLEHETSHELRHHIFLTKRGKYFDGTLKMQKVTLGSSHYLITVVCQDASPTFEQPLEHRLDYSKTHN